MKMVVATYVLKRLTVFNALEHNLFFQSSLYTWNLFVTLYTGILEKDDLHKIYSS